MKKGALFWNEHDTKVFCEMCKEEVDAGNKLDEGYLSPAGYRNLELRFNSRTQRGYVKKHFKNRWNSLKLEYARWLELISSAGFGWDPETETFEADEDWWADHIRNNHWHAKFRNGPPDNLSLLEEIFGKAHVGEPPAIHIEDLGEDKEEDARVNIDEWDEDAELTTSAMKRAKLAIPGEGLREDREEANRFNIDRPDKDAELSPSVMEIAKSANPGEDLGEDREEATRVSTDGSDEDAELTPSAMKKAKLTIPGQDLAEDKEMATPANIDEPDKDAEPTPSAMEIAKSAERKVSSPMVATSTTKEDKNPVPQNYKKACNDLTTSAEPSSCDSSTVPTIREAVGLIRECGVSEGTALFYTATKVVALNPEYRELFALIRTREGRLDWLQRAHDDTAMRVHL